MSDNRSNKIRKVVLGSTLPKPVRVERDEIMRRKEREKFINGVPFDDD